MYYMCIHILNSSELTHVAAVDLGGAVYGQGSGSILEIVSCHGTERSLIDCEYYDQDDEPQCAHRKDAGVRCCK